MNFASPLQALKAASSPLRHETHIVLSQEHTRHLSVAEVSRQQTGDSLPSSFDLLSPDTLVASRIVAVFLNTERIRFHGADSLI